MGQLRRAAPRLLKQVGNQPHATKDDHEELPFDREPESSDEDIAVAATKDDEALPSSASMPSTASSYRTFEMLDNQQPRNQKVYGSKYSSPRHQPQLQLSENGQVSKPFRNNQASKAEGAKQKVASDSVFIPPPTRRPGAKSPPDTPDFKHPPLHSSKRKTRGGSLSSVDGKKRKDVPPSSNGSDVFKKPRSSNELGAPRRLTRSSAKEVDSFVNPRSDIESRTRKSPISPVSLAVGQIHDEPEIAKGPAKCPMCGKEVATELLDEFKKQSNTISIRVQRQFCINHKTREAKSTWKERGYPSIDWDNLNNRLDLYKDGVAQILEHPEKSYFRKELEKSINKGEGRFSMNKVENFGGQFLCLGYYGLRGLEEVMTFITSHFSATLREQAGVDKVISGRGVAAYVQMVLAQEVGTLMIMEDMKVEEERAREIIKESSDIGYRLHGSRDSEPASGWVEKLS